MRALWLLLVGMIAALPVVALAPIFEELVYDLFNGPPWFFPIYQPPSLFPLVIPLSLLLLLLFPFRFRR
jgi:hypothetical protein